MIYSDIELSRKLERTEARANADFVETRARVSPESGAAWMDVGGVYAMFDGVESPCTQTFGLGMFDCVSHADMDTIERFFVDRGAPVFHEVSPMADGSTMSLLVDRGYRPVELSNVMFRALDPTEQCVTGAPITTRVITPEEVDLWA